jgi:hypothetical protein
MATLSAVIAGPGWSADAGRRAGQGLGAGGEIGAGAQVGFHGHRHLSLGVANSVLAYESGARQVERALVGAGRGPGQCADRDSGGDVRAARDPGRG